MTIAAVFTAIRSRWESQIPSTPLRFFQAQGTTKPPYADYTFSDITSNELDTLNRDWSVILGFTAYNLTDDMAFAAADAIVLAYDRQPIAGLYSSLIQSVSIQPHYGDQGAFWSTSVSVEFRWQS